MKSAYDRAMERFGGDDPVVSLTDEQKAELAEIEKSYKAKIAEKDLFLNGLIQKSGDPVEIQQIEEQKRREISKLESDREAAKEKIRQVEKD